MTKEIIKIDNLTKNYIYNKNKTIILKDINFFLKESEIISISGPSGSGKSTFLNILGLMDSDFTGNFYFLNNDVKNISFRNKNIIRNQSIGFVHQFFHLLPELNVLENIILPNLIKKNEYSQSVELGKEIIHNFNLDDQMYSKPTNLSGGEQQRVSIARALINKPKIIIADEMTGNLDEKTANLVFNFFLKKIKDNKQTLVYVTHNKKYALKADKKYEISNHKLINI